MRSLVHHHREDVQGRWETTREELTHEFKRKHKSASRRVRRNGTARRKPPTGPR